MNIADRIIKLRKEAGLSQEAFAEKLGVSRQSVSKWESGNVTPDLNNLVAMCELFGVTSDYILYGEDTVAANSYQEPETKTYEEVYVGEDYADETYEETPVTETAKDKNAKTSNNKKTKIIAAVLACCILIAAILPISFGGYGKLLAKIKGNNVNGTITAPADGSAYPYVLVHGLGGWGESAGINSVAPYWGASTGSLSEYLRGEGYQVCEVTVGPFSSAWDRACELYAQLTGTTVDYGAAHSKEHGHDRYGKEYSTVLYDGWGEKNADGQLQKINLVGHSFGGTTIRLLASLMEYGSEAEQKASPDNLSPLFKGGKGDWINSVATLCSPHNGSTLYYVADKGVIISSMLGLLQLAGSVTDLVEGGIIDFQLDHFGIKSDSDNTLSLVNTAFMSGKDNALYDLSPHGAKELNENIKTVNSIYYFSYSYCTTEKSALSNNQVPANSTLPVLMWPAKLIGSYTDTSDDAPVKIDESWLPNDGLVNVVSAKYPSGEKHIDYTQGMKIEKGIWHVLPTLEGHHGTVIGMDGNAEDTHGFYITMFTMIDGLSTTN